MSSTFTVSRDQIIQLALRKLGVLELGETPDTPTVANASMALNLLLKQLGTDGLKIWKTNELTLPLVANQTDYVIGPTGPDLITDKPYKVIQAWLRNVLITPPDDIPMTLLSKQEYNVLGSKQSTGVPNSVFYEVKQNTGILHVYTMPDAYTQSTYEVHIVCQQPINDLLKGADIPDFPNEWMNCLVWNLADQLAIEYSVPQNHRQEIVVRAKTYRDDMSDWDVEQNSTFFMPDLRMRNYTFGNTI